MGALGTAPAIALDNDRLWLPKKYRRHYLELRDAALAVEATDRCTEVLRGTLDQDHLPVETVVFRILCRDAAGHSYSELIESETLRLLSASQQDAPPETARERELRAAAEAQAKAEQEAEAQRLAAEQAQLQAEAERQAEEQAREEEEAKERQARELARRKIVFEEICRREIVAKTAQMINLTWITEKPVIEELDNGQLRFHTEFDAENPWGKTLAYRAVCTISTPAEYVVVLSPRSARKQ